MAQQFYIEATLNTTVSITGSHTGFPCLMVISPTLFPAQFADLAANARPDGFDFQVRETDGVTVIPHDLIYWDNIVGLVIGVKRNVTDVSDLLVRLYYGDPSQATTLSTPPLVWDNGYSDVRICNSATTVIDRTGNHANATFVGAPPVGFDDNRGVYLNFDGVAQELLLPEFSPGTAEVTIETLSFPEVLAGADQRMGTHQDGTAEADHDWMVGTTDSAGTFFFRMRLKTADAGVTVTVVGLNAILPNNWFYAVAWYDSANAFNAKVLYSDATGTFSIDNQTGAGTGDLVTRAGFDPEIGGASTVPVFFDGPIAMVLCSEVARDFNWMKSFRDVMASASAFLSLGAQQSVTNVTIVETQLAQTESIIAEANQSPPNATIIETQSAQTESIVVQTNQSPPSGFIRGATGGLGLSLALIRRRRRL